MLSLKLLLITAATAFLVAAADLPRAYCACFIETLGRAKGQYHCGEDLHCACVNGNLKGGVEQCADTCPDSAASSTMVAWASSVCGEGLEATSSTSSFARTTLDSTESSDPATTLSQVSVSSSGLVVTILHTLSRTSRVPAATTNGVPPHATDLADDNDTGLSKGAKVGIGVSIPIAGLIVVLLYVGVHVHLSRRRGASEMPDVAPVEEKKMQVGENQKTQEGDNHEIHEIDGNEVRGWELEAQVGKAQGGC